MKKKKPYMILWAISLFLVTASWNHYQPPSFSILSETTTFPFEKSEKGVKVTAKAYSGKESHNYLEHDFLASGYIPIEITIHNHTKKSYALSAASVPLNTSTSGDLAWSITKKRLPFSFGLKIASFFFWPLMIPSTIEGIQGYKAHRSLAKDLEAKTLKEKDEIIPPYATVTRVIYVQEELFRNDFSVALQEVDGKELLVTPVSLESDS